MTTRILLAIALSALALGLSQGMAERDHHIHKKGVIYHV